MTDGPSSTWAIELQGLTKSFGSQPVLRGVELKVREGDFLTIFGPNGAGKTTLLRILATFMRPNRGSGQVAGFDLIKRSRDIRACLGLVSHDNLLYDNLSGYENLKFYGRMYNVPHLEDRIAEVATQVGMEARLHQRVGAMSHGMKKRFAIARAILHKPSIILLDEPESGLDQEALAMLTGIITSLGPRRTVIMTTHNIGQGLRLANEVGILVRGKVVFQGAKPTEDSRAFSDVYHHYVEAHR